MLLLAVIITCIAIITIIVIIICIINPNMFSISMIVIIQLITLLEGDRRHRVRHQDQPRLESGPLQRLRENAKDQIRLCFSRKANLAV